MSCPAGPNYCVFRGKTLVIPLTFTNADGSAVDLTGYVITFAAKKDIAQAGYDIEVTAVITDIPGGLATISLTTADTDLDPAGFTYDVDFRNSGDVIVGGYQGKFNINDVVYP